MSWFVIGGTAESVARFAVGCASDAIALDALVVSVAGAVVEVADVWERWEETNETEEL